MRNWIVPAVLAGGLSLAMIVTTLSERDVYLMWRDSDLRASWQALTSDGEVSRASGWPVSPVRPMAEGVWSVVTGIGTRVTSLFSGTREPAPSPAPQTRASEDIASSLMPSFAGQIVDLVRQRGLNRDTAQQVLCALRTQGIRTMSNIAGLPRDAVTSVTGYVRDGAQAGTDAPAPAKVD